MRIRVDSEACADDNGYIATSGFTVGPGQEQLAMRGARACPERVIHIVDESPAGSG
jgi:ferredoxin